jgi:DNA (cytosine-5)-methyltransferase 1
VAALVNEQNRPWFDQWRQVLTRLGYDSAWAVMNARQFGVPQNRERVFCVSWRRDLFPYRAVFPFPKPIPLTRCIADVLEPDASPALYLKPESVTSFLQKNEDGQQQYIYATVSHRPTSTQIDALIAEQTTISQLPRS